MQLLGFLFNPLVLILLLASAISGILGDVTNAAIIGSIVAVSVAINFFQDYRSQRAAEQLRRLVQSPASVLRDGKWLELPMAEVVPGDVIRLSAGDLVPADSRLLEERDLSINQAALTGESFPANKQAGDLPDDSSVPIDEATNATFMGTSVVSGSAICLVVHTGVTTELGHIGQRLRGRPAETEFERGTRRYGVLITRTVIFLVIFVFLVNALARRDPLESFLFAVALAVGLTPEFLPMIISVTLAQGALRMARKKVIVKHLPSIENFGSMDILCTDKTGTITAGEIHVASSLDWQGNRSDVPLRLAYLNSACETGIKSALDQAIVEHPPADAVPATKLDELPFDFLRRRLSVVVEDGGGTPLLVTKGAPESVLPVCTRLSTTQGEAPLDSAARETVQATFSRLSAEGYRLLAVGFRRIEKRPAYAPEDEAELVFAGFVSFMDPPQEDVAETLQTLHQDGVTVKILTGDNDLVTHHVCDYLVKPRRWNTSFIQLFMVVLGPISSIYDFLTFFVLLKVLQSSEVLFHTGWFVESLATQTLVIFVIRTTGNPFRSRPSRSLLAGVLVTVAVGLLLPYSPWAATLGFAAPPLGFYVFLTLVVAAYLVQVQLIKPWFYRHASL